MHIATGIPVTLYVLSVYQYPIGTFLEMSAEFEIGELDCKINWVDVHPTQDLPLVQKRSGSQVVEHITAQWLRTGSADGAVFLFAEQRWPPDVLVALQENEMSMAAGEGYGAVVMADAVLTELETATHMVVFTDSSATEAAINSGNSPSPQMNFLVRWLVERWSNVQFLAVWVPLPGIHNEAADGISRVALDSVAAAVAAAEWRMQRRLTWL